MAQRTVPRRCAAPVAALLALAPLASAVSQDGAVSQHGVPERPAADPLRGLEPLEGAPFLAGAVERDGHRTPYLLLPPAEIEPGVRYPLVLFLHGGGERGDDNRAQRRHFPERMATPEYRARYPCFVLAPQCPDGATWTPFDDDHRALAPTGEPTPPLAGAMAALIETARAWPIDTDRIQLTGLSLGGFGAWELGGRAPNWFASVTPVCGGGHASLAADLAGTPVSLWHGADDSIVPPARTRALVDALRAVGVEPRYRELEGVGHDAWNAAYGAGGCLDWMFAQVRDPDAQLAAAARLLADALAPDERVAFLGDSITESGALDGGYVDRLRDVLAERRRDVTVIPAGISGQRVPDLLARSEADIVEPGATLVFVYIGINDAWHTDHGRGTPPDDYEAGLRTLVRELRASGADVVLATPTTIGERTFGTNRLDALLADLRARVRRVAAEEGATLCDLGLAFGRALALQNPAEAEEGVLTTDGVHLNAAGNRLVAVEAARALRRAVLARP